MMSNGSGLCPTLNYNTLSKSFKDYYYGNERRID